jgi:hypothetical protein
MWLMFLPLACRGRRCANPLHSLDVNFQHSEDLEKILICSEAKSASKNSAKGADPSIQNWLEYYDRKTGFESTSPIDRSKFFSTDDAVLQLNPDDKSLLRSILSFYDYLRTNELVSVDESLFEYSEETAPPVNRKDQVIDLSIPKSSAPDVFPPNTSAPQAPSQPQQPPQPLQRGKTVDLRQQLKK